MANCTLSAHVCDYPNFGLDVEACSCMSIAEHVGSVYYAVMAYYFLTSIILGALMSWYLWPRIYEAREAKKKTNEWDQLLHDSETVTVTVTDSQTDSKETQSESAVSKLRRLSTISRNLAAKLVDQEQSRGNAGDASMEPASGPGPGPGPGGSESEPESESECESECESESDSKSTSAVTVTVTAIDNDIVAAGAGAGAGAAGAGAAGAAGAGAAASTAAGAAESESDDEKVATTSTTSRLTVSDNPAPTFAKSAVDVTQSVPSSSEIDSTSSSQTAHTLSSASESEAVAVTVSVTTAAESGRTETDTVSEPDSDPESFPESDPSPRYSMTSPTSNEQPILDSSVQSLVADSKSQTLISKFVTYMLIAAELAAFTFFIRAFDPMSAAGRLPFVLSRLLNNVGSAANIYLADLMAQFMVRLAVPQLHYHPMRRIVVNVSRMCYVLALIAAAASGIVLEHFWIFLSLSLCFFCIALARLTFDFGMILWVQYRNRHLIMQHQFLSKLSFDDNGSGRLIRRVKQGRRFCLVISTIAILILSGSILANMSIAAGVINDQPSSTNPASLPSASTWVIQQLIHLLQPVAWCVLLFAAHFIPQHASKSGMGRGHEYAVIRPRFGTVGSKTAATVTSTAASRSVADTVTAHGATTPRSRNNAPLQLLLLDSKSQTNRPDIGLTVTGVRAARTVSSNAPGLLWQGSMNGSKAGRHRSQTASFIAPTPTTPQQTLSARMTLSSTPIIVESVDSMFGSSPSESDRTSRIGSRAGPLHVPQSLPRGVPRSGRRIAMSSSDTAESKKARDAALQSVSGKETRGGTVTVGTSTSVCDTSIPMCGEDDRVAANPGPESDGDMALQAHRHQLADSVTVAATVTTSESAYTATVRDDEARPYGKNLVNRVQSMMAKNYIVQKSQTIHRATRPFWIAMRNILFILDFGSDILLFVLLLRAAQSDESHGLYAASIFVIIFVVLPYIVIAYMMFFKIFFVGSRIYASAMQMGETPVHRALDRARARGSLIRLSQVQVFTYTLRHYPLPTLAFISCYVIFAVPLFVVFDAVLATYYLFQSVTHRPLLSFYQQSRHITQLAFESCPQVVLQLFLLAFSVRTSQTGVDIVVYSFLATVMSIMRSIYSVYVHAGVLGIPRNEYVKYVLSAGSRSQGIPLLEVTHVDAMRNNEAEQVTFQRIMSLAKLKLTLDEVARCKNCRHVNFKDCGGVMKGKDGVKLLCSYFSRGEFMHVRRLSLIRCRLSDNDVFRISTVVDWYGQVKVLRLDGNSELSDDALRYVADRLVRNNSDLAHLSLLGCKKLTSSGLQAIAHASQYSSCLVHVSVDESVRNACDVNTWQELEHQLQLTSLFALVQLSMKE
jgi:hypothetical protein